MLMPEPGGVENLEGTVAAGDGTAGGTGVDGTAAAAGDVLIPGRGRVPNGLVVAAMELGRFPLIPP